MKIETGTVALISGGRTENLGKVVFIVGAPDDPKLPDLGGAGKSWDVQMVSGGLVGSDGRDYLRSKIGESCLTPLNFTMEQARDMRERALTKLVEIAMTELLKEELWGESPDEE